MDQPLSPAADRHECSIRELSLDWTCMERQIYQGRNREHVKRLFEAYQPTKSSSSSSPSENEVNLQILKPKQQAFVLITGPSGVGKTSLALTLKARMQQDAFGFFCQGKFDQLTNCMAAEFATAAPENNAYDPFVAAVTAWVHYVCQKEQSYIQAVKKSILMELDSTEIQVMEESILALQRITRRRSFANEAAPKKLSHWRGLKGIEAEKRYMHIFAKFIKAICSPDHPIVLFIEDLQWADRNSLELLQVLATTTNMTGLLLLCTLRADDALLMDSEALSTLAELKEKGVQITEIQLRNLSGMAINDLLSSILNLSPIETCAFSKLVHQQTNGNPFFIRQFLSVLWKDGLLYREKATDKFSWKEEEITLAFHSPQSVTSLLVKLMLQLTEHEQRILQLASCLGGTIHECLLLEVVVPCSGVRCALENLTDQGLINFDAINGTGQFLHDRIQEAAYSLIPESKRAAMHLEIGLRLWIWLKPCHREAHLFTIANQIIHGMHLLDDPVEKEELAAFMLRVGEKAALLSSFSAAAVYFDVGISLLERKHWKSQYQLSLLLYNAAIEVQYYSGNLARVDTLLEVIFKRAKSFDDKLRAHFIQIYSLGSRDDMAQALTRGLEVLKLLGESFPRNPSKFEAAFALSRCRWSLRRMSDDDIMRLPTMSNKHQLVVMRLLNTVFVFAWLKEELIPLMVFRMIEITTRHGMSSSSEY
jgi:predicted ATPase